VNVARPFAQALEFAFPHRSFGRLSQSQNLFAETKTVWQNNFWPKRLILKFKYRL
jgi:hypothetical protein